MTNTPESDTMKTLTECVKENGGFEVNGSEFFTRPTICFSDESKLLATFNAWSAQQEPRFYLEHGLWHDRVTGQHMYTQDQYDELRRDAFHNGYQSNE